VVLIPVVLAIVAGVWCLQIAWRLFSGHERKWGGGLLSPFVLTLTAITFFGFAIYMLWDRGVGAVGGAVVFFTCGGAAFSTAVVQRRRARLQQVGAKHAF